MEHQHSVRQLPGAPRGGGKEKPFLLGIGIGKSLPSPLFAMAQPSSPCTDQTQGSVFREGDLVEVDAAGDGALGGSLLVGLCFPLVEG